MNNAEKLVLKVTGNIPSFKNRKRAIQDRSTGKMRTLTEPETKKRMEQIIKSFVYQLCCITQIPGDGILTEQQARSLIVLLLPEDDSWKHIPELHIFSEMVEPGNEGAEITIEKLQS